MLASISGERLDDRHVLRRQQFGAAQRARQQQAEEARRRPCGRRSPWAARGARRSPARARRGRRHRLDPRQIIDRARGRLPAVSSADFFGSAAAISSPFSGRYAGRDGSVHRRTPRPVKAKAARGRSPQMAPDAGAGVNCLRFLFRRRKNHVAVAQICRRAWRRTSAVASASRSPIPRGSGLTGCRPRRDAG